MTYLEQLNSNNWLKKRTIILDRDNYQCQNCNNHEYTLHFQQGIGLFNREFGDNRVFQIKDTNILIIVPKSISSNNSLYFYYIEPEEKFGYSNYVAIREIENLDYQIKRFERFKLYDEYRTKSPAQIQAWKIFFDLDKFSEEELNNRIKNIPSFPKEFKFNWLDLKNLHVHHKYYQEGKMAWEYPDEALVTLCWFCHDKLHRNSEISILDEYGNLLDPKQVCFRCHGAGYFPQFAHVENGICFRCDGNRFEVL